MIRALHGKIENIGEKSVVINVNGVGYLAYVPNTGSFGLGENVILHTYLAVRENALDLYGFVTNDELTMFELLLKVPKIGPKSSLQVLSQASLDVLISAIVKHDAVYLQKMSAVSKKASENIVQNLEGKLPEGFEKKKSAESPTSDIHHDAIDALVTLGYDLQTARETITELQKQDEEYSTNQLITLALKEIK